MLKVLMLSLDSSILNENSISAGRMKEYGSICSELHIIVLGGGAKKLQLSKNVFVYGTDTDRIKALFRAYNIGKKILNQENRWIITSQHPFEGGFIAWLLSKKFKTGLEIQLHGDFYSSSFWRGENILNKLRYYLGKFVLGRAGSVRAVSQRVEDSISPFLKKDATVFRNPIYFDKSKWALDSKSLEGQDGYPKLLAIGNLVPVKNHRQLIEVFKEIKKEFHGAKLIIVGGGPLMNSLKGEEGVSLVGYQDNLGKFYNWADILIHPSLYEGWGRAGVEAAYFNVPTIMSDVGLAGEVIKDHESGLVVPVNDKKALKEAIIKLTNDKELQRRLAKNAALAVAPLLDKEGYYTAIKESWEAALN